MATDVERAWEYLVDELEDNYDPDEEYHRDMYGDAEREWQQ